MFPVWLQALLVVLVFAGAGVAALHALLTKPDPRAALGWVVVCLAYPVFGPLGYLLFGINRIHTKAQSLGERWGTIASPAAFEPPDLRTAPFYSKGMAELAQVSDTVTRRPVLAGNLIEPLHCGEEAYPAMRAAIDAAEECVWLATYIFETDETGRELSDALGRATARGVEVRVLLDGVGELYSWPRARRLLAERGVRVARFLPPRLTAIHLNLRNHRKLMIVDRRIGFTGGMNIGGRHMVSTAPPRRCARDVHFRVQGPVVGHLEAAFCEDWGFAAGEDLDPGAPLEFPPAGDSFARGISDGPNEDYEQLMWILLGAVHAARSRVRIMTPYFLPDRELEAALITAAMRGIEVDVLLPGRNNLPFVHWACQAMLPPLLERGVRVFHQPPPFDHSKILLVDDHYAMVGSANLDPRSLRLNFEYQLEVYGEEPARALNAHFEARRSAATEVDPEELTARPLWRQVRDHSFRLLQPYL